ncbi:MAG: hypothetical protein COB02_11425 [Candidatus Cloacimonadota bacterium]|nr:MAG: hypothetical protein COB02_11425 [Candidatus Cloacimonadota bacterium]
MKTYLIIFLLFLLKPINARGPLYFSAKGIRRIYRDKKPIKDMKEIQKDQRNDPYLFFRYLELYQDSKKPFERMKIMKEYYKTQSVDQYRLLSLMLLFNPYDPRKYTHQKLVDKFLVNHYHELDVLNIFLYRYSTINMNPPPSFTKLYLHLKQKINEFLPSEFKTILFLDFMMSQEVHSYNRKKNLKTLLKFWTQQKVSQTAVYYLHRDFIKKAISFYSFHLSKAHYPQYFKDFHKKREYLFAKYGYSKENIIKNLETSLKLDPRIKNLPDFLPNMNQVKKDQEQPFYLQGL